MPDSQVALTDLEVIQQYSLAVRGATAPRDEVIAALQADLAWLQSGTPASDAAAPARPRAAKKPAKVTAAPVKPVKAAKPAPVRTAAPAAGAAAVTAAGSAPAAKAARGR